MGLFQTTNCKILHKHKVHGQSGLFDQCDSEIKLERDPVDLKLNWFWEKDPKKGKKINFLINLGSGNFLIF